MTNKLVSILTRFIIGCLFSAYAFSANASSSSFFQIVIDRTGSMIATRSSTGNTRYQDAITQAQSDLAKAMTEAVNNGGNLKVSVALFESSAGFEIRMGFENPDVAMAELEALKLMSPGYQTPLADALCFAADELFAQSPSDPYKRVIGFYTDLNENASSGECSGLDWTNKVIQKFFSGFPAPVFNVTMFATDDDLTVSTSAMNILNTSSLGVINKAAVPTSIKDEVTFMKALSQYTGGSAVGYADTKSAPIFDSGNSDCGVFFPCTSK